MQKLQWLKILLHKKRQNQVSTSDTNTELMTSSKESQLKL